MSGEFEGFLQECGIEHRKSPPLWPQANGEVERQNRTLLKSMKIAAEEEKRWIDELPKFLLAYRSTPQVSTGATPASLMLGKEIRTKLPELRPEKSLRDESMRDKDWEQKLMQKVYADGNRGAVPSPIVPGDQVPLKNTRETGKLAPKFETKPYTVLTKEGHQVTVESSEGAVYKRDSSSVKPYPGAPNDQFVVKCIIIPQLMKINVIKAFSGVFQCCWENIICSFFPARHTRNFLAS